MLRISNKLSAVAVTAILSSALIAVSAIFFTAEAQGNHVRLAEWLDRGIHATRTSNGGSNVLISWRFLATDPEDIGFNVYRKGSGNNHTKLNSSVITGATNFMLTGETMNRANTYFVTIVEGGVEREDPHYSECTLPANAPHMRKIIPLQTTNRNDIHLVWVGDFNGDGKYDFLVDRMNWSGSQKLEAYLDDGTFLWQIDLGPGSHGSANQNNISPGPSAINLGHWDGVTVYDLDMDGRAEVLLRGGNGIILGNGQTFNTGSSHANAQSILVIDGMTGGLKTSVRMPEDYINVGPLAAQMGVGHFHRNADGHAIPGLIVNTKNRNSNGSFNMLIMLYDYRDGTFRERWKWRRTNGAHADAHQIRLADADQDGLDEVHHIGFTLERDGTLKHSLGTRYGIVHGDRYFVGRFNRADRVLMGYGTQQYSTSIGEYYYNAATGDTVWTVRWADPDVARANVADLDPNYPGYEVWQFGGIRSNNRTSITGSFGSCSSPGNACLYPVLRLWWDGDEGSESYNDGKIEGWDYTTGRNTRILTLTGSEFGGILGSQRGSPQFHGDILGDWREEVVVANSNSTQLIIFSTWMPTDRRIFTPMQDKCYRAGTTVKGYQQSHMMEYYLGFGMFDGTPEARPRLVYMGERGGITQPNVCPPGTTGTPPNCVAIPTCTPGVDCDDDPCPEGMEGVRPNCTVPPPPENGWYIGSGEFIDSLRVFDATEANRAAWSVNLGGAATGLDAGSKVYGDRAFTATEIPAQLQGAEWIGTSMEGRKLVAPVKMAEFRMKKEGTVFILHENRVPTRPAWIEEGGFEETFLSVTVPDAGADRTFTVYAKDAAAGEIVTLGVNTPNGEANALMYLVAVTDKQTVSIKGRTFVNQNMRPMVTIRGRTLSISPPNNEALTIRMIDVRGRVRARFDANGNGNFSLAKIPAGRYFVDVRGAGVRQTLPVVIR